MTHILVVEDDALNALVFRKVLERHGSFRVTVSENADEIVSLCRSGDVALVIMDVSLANTRWEGRAVSGIELCQVLRGDPATAAIPVILATAHAMRGDSQSLIAQSGADGYVAKPILDHHAFVAQVRAQLKEAA